MRMPVKADFWGPLSWLGLALAVFAFLSDRLSKWWLLDIVDMPGRQLIEVTPFLNLVMAWNRGVSYGLFASETTMGRILLILFALAVIFGLGAWLARAGERLLAVAIGLVIGGALGNVYDRIVFGAVADFFSFHAFGFYWYIFNVADIWIVFGVALMCFDAIRGERAAADPKS